MDGKDVDETLATVSKSTKVPRLLSTTIEQAETMAASNRQAASVKDEIDTRQHQTKEKSTNPETHTTPEEQAMSSFPSYSPDQLAEMQSQDPSIRQFLNYWTKNQKPDAQDRQRDPKEALTLLKQWDRIKMEDGLLWRTTYDQTHGEVKQLVLPIVLRERESTNLSTQ